MGQKPMGNDVTQELPIRIGGLLLAAGAFAFIPIIFEYVFVVGAPTGTGAGGSITSADSAAHALSHWQTLSRGWRFEVLAIASVAAAAMTLMGRHGNGRPGWALVVVGVLITCPMYALMLGGYGAVLHTSDIDLGLYGALRASAIQFFHSGIGVMRLGLAMVFLAEVTTRCSKLWRAIFVLGFATNLIHGVFFMALFWGASIPLPIISPFGILGFVFTGILGLRLFKNPVPCQE
jgi:hypothetical protein